MRTYIQNRLDELLFGKVGSPELKQVVVAYGEQIVMANTLPDALKELFLELCLDRCQRNGSLQ